MLAALCLRRRDASQGLHVMNRIESMDPMVGDHGTASWDFRDCCSELQLCYATCHHGRKKIFDRLEGKMRCDQAYRECARQHCVEATGGRGPHSDMCEGDVGRPPCGATSTPVGICFLLLSARAYHCALLVAFVGLGALQESPCRPYPAVSNAASVQAPSHTRAQPPTAASHLPCAPFVNRWVRGVHERPI